MSSSSYRVLGPIALVPSGSMTGTETITSQIFDVRSFEGFAFQPTWTGTPTGTFSIQVSLDYVPNPAGGTPINAGTWSDLGASIPQNPSGGAGSTYVPVYGSCSAFVQLSYTNASGSGTLGGMFVGKTRG